MSKDGIELWAIKDGVCRHYRSIAAFNDDVSGVLSPGYLQSKIRRCRKNDILSFEYNGTTVHLRKPHGVTVENNQVQVKLSPKNKAKTAEHKKGQPLLRQLVTHKIH